MNEGLHGEGDMVKIVRENPGHGEAVYRINASAFETEAEAKLVDELREACTETISLVAERGGEAVGHILFSPVTVQGDLPLKLTGLAPLAVLPDYQKEGVGSLLVREGLAACRAAGYQGVVVLGHPDYYPRFGFRPSVQWGFRSEYEVPDEVFMALELAEGAFDPLKGTVVVFHPAFKNM